MNPAKLAMRSRSNVLKAPLFAVYAMCRDDVTLLSGTRGAPQRSPEEARQEAPLVVRGLDGRWTEDFVALRSRMGMPT